MMNEKEEGYRTGGSAESECVEQDGTDQGKAGGWEQVSEDMAHNMQMRDSWGHAVRDGEDQGSRED